MRWLFTRRLNVVDGMLIVIGSNLIASDYVIIGGLILTLCPILSAIGESIFTPGARKG